jgi:hypothetical protein
MEAGYSGTPLARKLGIKEDHRVAVLHAPASFQGALGTLPPGVRVGTELDDDEPFDVVVLFSTSLSQLESEFPEAARRLQPDGGLWVGWAKRTSPLSGELTGDVVRSAGLATGLVDNKVCAIDADWSGLRFVYRIEDRG